MVLGRVISLFTVVTHHHRDTCTNIVCYYNNLVFIVIKGISGPCDIGMNADKIPYFWVFQYRGENSVPLLVAESDNKNKVCHYVFMCCMVSWYISFLFYHIFSSYHCIRLYLCHNVWVITHVCTIHLFTLFANLS